MHRNIKTSTDAPARKQSAASRTNGSRVESSTSARKPLQNITNSPASSTAATKHAPVKKDEKRGASKPVKEAPKATAVTQKTTKKHTSSRKYLKFVVKGKVNSDFFKGTNKTPLGRSLMSSSQGGSHTKDPTPTEELVGHFMRVDAFGPSSQVFVPVAAGNEPELDFYLLADSGSAVTFFRKEIVDGHVAKHKTSDLLKHPQGEHVEMKFAGRKSPEAYRGELYKTSLTIDERFTIQDQQFVVVPNVTIPGILGLGPTSQTKNKIVGKPHKEIPTVLDNLIKGGHIQFNVLGINLRPWIEEEDEEYRLQGSLHFGAIDESAVILDTLKSIPVTAYSPLNIAYGIDAGVTYGDKNIDILDIGDRLATGLIDSGESGIALPPAAFAKYMQAINAEATAPEQGSKLDNWSIPRKNLLKMKPLTLHCTDEKGQKVKFELPVDAQFIPPIISKASGGKDDRLYLVVKERKNARDGYGFIFGVPIFTRLYFGFDFSNGKKVVKIAKTRHTNAESPGLAEIRKNQK